MKKEAFLNIRYIYFFAIIHCIALIIICGRQYYPDTASYIAAWDYFISNGHIDKWRTPVYPIFLGILKNIFGKDNYLLYAVVIQHIVFLISILYFHKLSKCIIKSNTIAYFLTVIYALYPCIPTWNCYIITEAFAIYGMIFLLYFIIHAHLKKSLLSFFNIIFWLTFLVFLRPALIYLLPIMIVGWGLLLIMGEKRSAIIGLCETLLVTLLLLCYTYSFKTSYGLFTPSAIGTINNYYIARMDGLLDPTVTNNIGLRDYINDSYKTHNKKYTNGTSYDVYKEAEDAINIYGLETVSKMVSISNTQNPNGFLKQLRLHFHRAASDKFLKTLLHKWTNITDIIGFRINIVYYLLLLYPILLIIWIVKKRIIPWYSIVLYMIGFCHLFIILIACQNEWDRLILPAVPIYLIMFGQLFNTIRLKYNNELEFI